MFKALKTICFVLLINFGIAQTHHFIYFENNKKEWFTVKVNNETYESIGKNFIVIPKLERGVYNFRITTQTANETLVTLNIDNEDKGYSIKVNENNEVELFDINSFKTVVNTSKPAQDFKKEIAKEATSIIQEKPKIISVPETEPTKKALEKTKIEKAFTKTNKDGVDEIYVDGKDTISIFIPSEKIINVAPASVVEPKPEEKIVSVATNTNSDVVINTKNDCKTFADESDVKNMIVALQAEVKVKERLKLATLFMKDKCYSVNQIKRLSGLFINSTGKFLFFKQVQQNVSDLNNFGQLVTELTEFKVVEEFKIFVKQL